MRAHALFLTLALVASPAVLADAPDRVVLPTDVVPTHYDLTISPDAAKLSFKGVVKVDLDVQQDTQTIQLNAADLVFSKVSLSGVKGAPKVSFDNDQQTATLTFAHPVKAGHHVLSISYSGKINQGPAGLFALDYLSVQGKKRALFTQFENSDARRFLPSWDEPGIKSTFTLTADVPKGEMAVSNMPVNGKAKTLKGGLQQVRFQTTPKMSSYLLFFALGDFERIHETVDGVDVGVITQRGSASKGQFSLDAAAHILPYYDEYFGIKYPLPKLDLIAGPGQSQFFGAMENWGAIFSFEGLQLIDPKVSTQNDRIAVYTTVAHEMAHQWFGDLVTMAWWDDLWLNEGFATWMQSKATDQFHPEWNIWLQDLDTNYFLGNEVAMKLDARAGTHPIITPIHDVQQANNAFDLITYGKGQAVIHMLENYVGADAFRAGVRLYMHDHAYGNTVTDQLWAELDKTTSVPVTQVAHDFTLQAGVPLIRVTSTPTGIHLEQDRYTSDGTGTEPTVWHVPVIVAAAGGSTVWQGLVSRDKPVDVPLSAGTVPVVNAGHAGYYRTLYDTPTLTKLAADYATLNPADQLGLLNDTSSLGESGYESMGDYMQLTSGLTPDLNPAVLNSAIGTLSTLDFDYEGLPGQAAFKAYCRKVLDPVLAKVGWDPQAGEAPTVAVLRSTLLNALSQFDDPAVVAEANKRFAAYLKDPASLSGDGLQNVLTIVAVHADDATWDQLHAFIKGTKSNLEKLKYYPLLGAAHDPAVAKRALDLALTDEAPETVRPTMAGFVAFYYPDMAMDFVTAHWDTFEKLLEQAGRARFVPQMVPSARDQGMIDKLEAYAKANNVQPTDRADYDRTESTIRVRIKIRQESLPQVDAWLAAHPN